MEKAVRKGSIFVISGPSGVGKGTLLKVLLKEFQDLSISISATTRKPRFGEFNGMDYFFTTKEDFEKLVKQGELLEWAEFADNYYGTYKRYVEDAISQGKDIVLEIDVKGAVQVKEKIKEAVLIFIKPPSFEELQSRLFKRSTESNELIDKRLSIVKDELKMIDYFDYEVVNCNIEKAYEKLKSVVIAQRCKITK